MSYHPEPLPELTQPGRQRLEGGAQLYLSCFVPGDYDVTGPTFVRVELDQSFVDHLLARRTLLVDASLSMLEERTSPDDWHDDDSVDVSPRHWALRIGESSFWFVGHGKELSMETRQMEFAVLLQALNAGPTRDCSDYVRWVGQNLVYDSSNASDFLVELMELVPELEAQENEARMCDVIASAESSPAPASTRRRRPAL